MDCQSKETQQDTNTSEMELDQTPNPTGPESNEVRLLKSLENAFEWLKYPEPRALTPRVHDQEYDEWAEELYKRWSCGSHSARTNVRCHWVAFLRQLAELQDEKIDRVHKVRLPVGMAMEEYDMEVSRVYFAERPLREEFPPLEVYRFARMRVLAPLYRAETTINEVRSGVDLPRYSELEGRDGAVFEAVMRYMRPKLPWLDDPELQQHQEDIFFLDSIPPLPKSVDEACKDPKVKEAVERFDRWVREQESGDEARKDSDVKASVESFDECARAQKRQRSDW